MPLPMPLLDKRNWADLVSEARSLIPRYAPAWTDHNVHDPGITLVELFAWLSEILMFRADRIPPAELRAFLRWLGIAPLPAQVACTELALRLPASGVGATLIGGLKVADPTSGLVFEADDPIFISPAWLELSAAEGTHRGQIWTQAVGNFTDLTGHNCREGFDFWPLGQAPAPGDALWLGFDCSPALPGQRLSLHVWTDTWRGDADVKRQLIDEEAAREPCPPPPPSWQTRQECLNGVVPTPIGPIPAPQWFLHYSARVVWEGWDGAVWQPFNVVADETRALTLSGQVQLTVVAALVADPPAAPSRARWWIRCRLTGGSFECPPRLAGIAVNAVAAADSARIAGPEVIGVSQGHAEEVFYLEGKVTEQGPLAAAQPVVAGSVRLQLTGGGPPDTAWTEVPNWDRTGPFDRHVLIDPTDNSVHFGNGRVGRVALADWAVEALEYRVGGGSAGNLAAGRLSEVVSGGVPGLAVLQPFAAQGGAEAETQGQTHGRALGLLAQPRRGITASDWIQLALQTPGVPVARAMAIPGYLAELGCWTAPGVVTLIVLPGCGRPPVPGPAFLAAVARYLEPRRPLTTELHVEGPLYVSVTVTATLHASGPATGLAARGQAALDAFFDPLTGGPDGTGWPFGRGVLASDVADVLAELPGVLYVDGIGISADSGASRCDNLGLCPMDLVASQVHQIRVVEA